MQVIKPRKPIRSNKLLIISVVLILAVIIFLSLELTGLTHLTNLRNTKTTEQIQEDEINSDDKKDFIDGKTNNNTDTVVEPTVDDITISVTKESDGKVTIITQLKNYSDGTCNLTITNGGDTYNQSAQILYQSSFSTCAGFSIPANQLDDGTWQIKLEATSKGKTNTKSISVEIK